MWVGGGPTIHHYPHLSTDGVKVFTFSSVSAVQGSAVLLRELALVSITNGQTQPTDVNGTPQPAQCAPGKMLFSSPARVQRAEEREAGQSFIATPTAYRAAARAPGAKRQRTRAREEDS